MDQRRRDDRTRFTPHYFAGDLFAVGENHDLTGTTDVASEFGIERPSAGSRLRHFEEGQSVASKKIGKPIGLSGLNWRDNA